MRPAPYDIIIVGAGPAGSSAALALSGSGRSVALIDKSHFPRDKICGDALSPDVVMQLSKLPIPHDAFKTDLPDKIWSKAIRFVSPSFNHADLSLNRTAMCGYVSPRSAFDAFLFSYARACDHVDAITGHAVEDIVIDDDGGYVQLSNGAGLKGDIILGADGANSVVKRLLHRETPDKNHYCAGLRMYFEGVTGFSNDNAVELHFYREILPGYFWMFPLPGNRANVGIGMLSSRIAKKKINLKKILHHMIDEHPNVAHRFKDASVINDAQGFPLPLGSKKRKISGGRYLLLGDAASLINPLSGEGIANAIRSGRIAAEHILSNWDDKQFSADHNRQYDREVYRRMWRELRLNYWLQRVMRNPGRANWVVKHAISSSWVQQAIMSGFQPEKTLKGIFFSQHHHSR